MIHSNAWKNLLPDVGETTAYGRIHPGEALVPSYRTIALDLATSLRIATYTQFDVFQVIMHICPSNQTIALTAALRP